MAQPPAAAFALVVDDQPQSVQWLSAAVRLAYPSLAVRCADTLAAARQQLHDGVPQLALVDLDLPDGSGISLIEELARSAPRPRIVVATVFADDRHVFPALRAGADGYLLKDDSVERLAELLRALPAGGAALSPSIAHRLMGWFRAPAREADAALSPREVELLTLLAKGLTIAAAARTLGVTPATAASYAKTLYRKLDVTTRAEATIEAARRGLVKP